MKLNRKDEAAGSTVRPGRRAFTTEFKVEAVRLMAAKRASGVSLAQVSRELGVRPDQLRAWALQYRPAPGEDPPVPEETLEQENRRLRREVAVLREEQAFVKKVAAYFAKESR